MRDVSVSIQGKTVLQSVSLEARPSEVLILAGVSGSGKSTLLNVLGLLQPTTSGFVNVNGVDSTRWRGSRRRNFWKQHTAFVFQDYGLVEDENVEFNVTIGKRAFRRVGSVERERLDGILRHVRLDGRNLEQVARLSGGEKQRVGLARAMYREASVVLADEPTASLDRDNRGLVTRYLQEEARRGATVVVATHDEELMSAGDRLVQLEDGFIVR